MVCRRGAGDKLLDKLALEWSVNLLRIPRTGINVGDVFVVHRRTLIQWDRLASLYQPKLELPEPEHQSMPDMDQIRSKSYSDSASIDALQGFLQGLGVPPLPLNAAIKAARESSVSLSFSVGDVTRKGLLAGEIKREMKRRSRGSRWDGVDVKLEYVVAHAVWEATSLQIRLDGAGKTVGKLSATMKGVTSTTAGVTVTHDSSNTVKYCRQEPIVFGIEVTNIRFQDGVPQLKDVPDLKPRPVRQSAEQASPTADEPKAGILIGARNGSPFIAVG